MAINTILHPISKTGIGEPQWNLRSVNDVEKSRHKGVIYYDLDLNKWIRKHRVQLNQTNINL